VLRGTWSPLRDLSSDGTKDAEGCRYFYQHQSTSQSNQELP
jgi:hypothetical protein